MHSSNIEGNTVNFDTYLKASEFNLHLKTKEIKEIEDLISAYQFARENELTLENILKQTIELVKKEKKTTDKNILYIDKELYEFDGIRNYADLIVTGKQIGRAHV